MSNNNTSLPAEVIEKIDKDAEYVAALHFHPHYSQDANTACRICYRTGAKEYAQWYVKSTALESELHGVRAENERLKTALKQFISYHETGLLPDRFAYEKGVEAMKGEVSGE